MIYNLDWDFNNPLDDGVTTYWNPELGDTIRLVDMDPTAGVMLVKVVGLRLLGRSSPIHPDGKWKCAVESVPGSYVPW